MKKASFAGSRFERNHIGIQDLQPMAISKRLFLVNVLYSWVDWFQFNHCFKVSLILPCVSTFVLYILYTPLQPQVLFFFSLLDIQTSYTMPLVANSINVFLNQNRSDFFTFLFRPNSYYLQLSLQKFSSTSNQPVLQEFCKEILFCMYLLWNHQRIIIHYFVKLLFLMFIFFIFIQYICRIQ